MHKSALVAIELCAAVLSVACAHAQTNHYVWTNSPSSSSPYTNWATAAHDIQAAIDAAAVGDVIWVTNGVYDTGGRTNYPSNTSLTNRVVIAKAVTVRSVNGPDVTFIKGARDPVATNGPAAVRCVYMSAGFLTGFTLTNGATLAVADATRGSGGAVLGVGGSAANPNVISNCVMVGNSAYCYGGALYLWYGDIRLYDCRLIGNSSSNNAGGAGTWSIGGGYQVTLTNCVFTGNSSGYRGGGAWNAVMYNCTMSGNTAAYQGGGACASVLYHCEATGNFGSGATSCTLYHCLVAGNSGGGTVFGNLYNCLVAGNQGQGVRTPYALENSTVVGNDIGVSKGGIGIMATNSVIYYNQTNYEGGAEFCYSCTFPHPGGVGNKTNAPLFADSGSGYGLSHVTGNYRLKKGSPCVNNGLNFSWMTDPGDPQGRNFDLDGGPRVRHSNVDMGAYELRVKRGTTFSAE